jgi:isochorismate hydrolase
MRKLKYVTARELPEWTEGILQGLEREKGRERMPSLDSSTALLLLDLQDIFVSESSPAYLPAWEAVRENCRSLLDRARRCSCLTVATRHVHPAEDGGGSILHFFGRLIREEDPLAAMSEASGVREGVTVLEKPRHSAFSNPRLKEMLLERRIRTVVVAGVQAHLCVLATAVEAGTNDFIPVVAADAVASGNERQHRAAVESLAGGLACIMSTKEVLERWHSQNFMTRHRA